MAKRKGSSVTATEAASKAKDAEALKFLLPKAKEINATLDRAKTAQTRADDLRLTAARMLLTCYEYCEQHKGGLTFKAFCEEHVTALSYDYSKVLLAIAKSPDPAVALNEIRQRTAARNRASRANKKAAASNTGSRGQVRENVSTAGAANHNPLTTALEAFAALDAPQRATVLRERAATVGMSVVPVKADSNVYTTVRATRATILQAFMTLPHDEQQELAIALAKQCGLQVAQPAAPKVPKAPRVRKNGVTKAPESADDLCDIPDFLKRS